MENPIFVDEWGPQAIPGPTNCHMDSCRGPRAVRIRVSAVARSTGRKRLSSEALRERLARLNHQFVLPLGTKETAFCCLRTPILIADPRHPPENVRRLCGPECLQKLGTFAVFCESSDRGRIREVCRAVQCWLKNSLVDPCTIGIKQARP